MKMKLTHKWRNHPPGTIIDATRGQQIMIETLGYGVPFAEPSVENRPLKDAMLELDAAMESVPMPAKKKDRK